MGLCQFFRFQLFASLLAPSYCSCASQLSTAPRRNAVKPKLGMGLSVYMLVAILKKQLGLDLSLHQIPQILSVTVFEKTLRSEEHTSELQSHSDLVCRLLLEKKKKKR